MKFNSPKVLWGKKTLEAPIHPTQKPEALFNFLIKSYSNEGDLILDAFIGSGTTAVSCMNTNRNFIGFEIDKEYYDLSIERLKCHENNPAK